MGGPGRSARLLGVLAFSALTVVLWPEQGMAAYPEVDSPFCKPKLLRDFLRPVKQLPPVHALEEAESPGFAPNRGVQIGGSEEEAQLLVGGSRRGYGKVGFTVEYMPEAGRLDWLVVAKLAMLDGRGNVDRHVASRIERVGTPTERLVHDFRFGFSEKPAIYRLELTFRDRAGRLLGRFGKYLRVVPVTYDTRFSLSADTYRLGETVLGRLENWGTAGTYYGIGYGIERFDGAGWAPAPETPKGFIQIGFRTPGGYAGICSGFTIPPTMPVGLYRMVKYADTLGTRNAPKRLVLPEEFEIVP